MELILKNIIRRYPSFISRLYAALRIKILPLEKIEQYIPKKGLILDIGCGYGLTSIYFALKSSQRKVLGLELNHGRIAAAIEASKNISNISFKQQDITKSSNLQDCKSIILIDLLHHIPYQAQFSLLKECIKKLDSNGILIIKDIAKNPKIKYFLNYTHDKIMTLNDKLYFQDTENIKGFLQKNGLIVESRRLSHFIYPHMLIIARKSK